MSGVYYNEFDHKAAVWLKELIKDGVIPDGEIDERSITDVRADELTGFRQCHFFTGAGGWPIALRLAGIPDDFPCWTGSCPCQPFSNAGKRKGMSDERDLWPVFFGLIKECKPQIVIGEQVSSSEVVGSELEASFIIAVQGGEYAKANKIAKKLAATKGFHYHQLWLDRVYSDLESAGYTGRPEVLGAHSVGAPHIRQRLYWGASRLAENSASLGWRGRNNADSAGDNRQIQTQGLVHGERMADSCITETNTAKPRQFSFGARVPFGSLGNSVRKNERRNSVSELENDLNGQTTELTGHCTTERLSDSDSQRCNGKPVPDERRPEMPETSRNSCSSISPWSDFGLVLCRDTDKQGRHRVRRVPAESLLLCVADGLPEELDRMRYQSILEHPERAFPLCKKGSVPGSSMLLKGIGNAIVPELAAEFMIVFLEKLNERD